MSLAPVGHTAHGRTVFLMNAGTIKPELLDGSKTTVRLLASRKVGPDLYRQIHAVQVWTKTGEMIAVVTINDASHDECSISGVEVYSQLGDAARPVLHAAMAVDGS
jgi:hypothetical protein